MLYTLNEYKVVCQLHLNKTGESRESQHDAAHVRRNDFRSHYTFPVQRQITPFDSIPFQEAIKNWKMAIEMQLK